MLPVNLETAKNHEATSNPLVFKPMFGSIGEQSVEFKMHREYSGADSKEQNREVYRDVEVCVIRNDKFCSAGIMTKDLSPQQKIDLAPIYEQFRSQKDSTDTRIIDWVAVSDQEKAQLMQAGVFTVEQLHAFTDDNAYKLGPNEKDFRERAERHITSKQNAKDETKQELLRLMEENAALKRQAADKQDAYFAAESQKVAVTSTSSKGKKESK